MTYKKPEKTYQMKLTEEQILEKLKDYVEIDDINTVPINTHIRYYITDSDNIKHFRMGGYLIKIDIVAGYIALSNGRSSWSVQLNTAILYRKKTDAELEKEKSDAIKQQATIDETLLKKKYNKLYAKNNLLDQEYIKLKEKFIQLYERHKNLKQKYEKSIS